MNRATLNLVVPVAVAVVLMGVSCYYQGVWSERWSQFPELEIYAAQLKEIPKNIGEWQGEDGQQSDEKVLEVAGAAGELVRTYRNASGQTVNVMVMCARFRDIFYHTPDRCYPAAGFEMQGQPQREVIDDSQFLTGEFLKSEPTGTHAERGYWSWSADGKWLAPKNQKVTFAGKNVLYKMYVFGPIAADEIGGSEQDYITDFIRAFIPAVQTALRPAMEKVDRLRAGDEVAEQPTQPTGEKAKQEPAAEAPAA